MFPVYVGKGFFRRLVQVLIKILFIFKRSKAIGATVQPPSFRRAVLAAASFAAIATGSPDSAVHAVTSPARHSSAAAMVIPDVWISHMGNNPGPATLLTPSSANC